MVKLNEKSNFKKLTLRGGISLITLVITIVVVIILAAAVILSLNNNNLITNANSATVKNDISEAQSAYSIYIGDLIIEELDNVQGKGTIGKITSNFVTTTAAGVEETRDITLADIGVDSNNVEEISVVGNTVVGIKWKNKYYDVNANTMTEENYTYLTKERLGEGTRDKTKAAYNVPYVPEGFTYKEGTVDTGYVIQDSIGNEFVWIPVDGTNVKYEKNLTYPGINSNLSDNTLPSGVTSEEEQITNYQGFYIARYEAGIPDTMSSPSNVEGIPVSKKGAVVWTNIGITNCKTNAESMINTDYVKSGLITGTMWDTVMLYLQNAGYDVASDSSSWGNYKDSSGNAAVTGYGSKQVSGFSDYWSVKGIYDIAGNTWEFTNELYSSSRVARGGGYGNSGSFYPASRRLNSYGGVTNYSFRVALYVM